MFSKRTKAALSMLMLSSMTLVVAPASAQDSSQAQTQNEAQNEAQNQARNQPGQRAEQMLSRLDTNGDGSINFEEFSSIPTPDFDRRDSNGDGNISRDEELEQRFTRMDRDGNGLLSAEELRAGRGDGPRGNMREMRERMQNMTPEQRARMREMMEQRRAQGETDSGATHNH